MPIPKAARSKMWVCGRSPAEIVGSNPAGGMEVCLLWVLCVVTQRTLRRADHSSRGVLSNVMRRYLWSRNLMNEEDMARVGPQRHKEICIINNNTKIIVQNTSQYKQIHDHVLS